MCFHSKSVEELTNDVALLNIKLDSLDIIFFELALEEVLFKCLLKENIWLSEVLKESCGL